MSTEESVPLLKIGENFRGYLIEDSIGSGGFGEVYRCVKAGEQFALKTEKVAEGVPSTIKIEAQILSEVSPNHHFPKMHGVGRTPVFSFLLLELMGEPIRKMDDAVPNWASVGLQMLKGVKILHSFGWIHRDVKIDNFMWSKNGTKLKLLDFGLSRKFVIPINLVPDARSVYGSTLQCQPGTGILRKTNQSAAAKASSHTFRRARAHVEARGTAEYFSTRIHERLEPGRVDDLWSLIYTIIDLKEGSLPWKRSHPRMFEEMKRNWRLVDLFDWNKKKKSGKNVKLNDLERKMELCHVYSSPPYLLLFEFLQSNVSPGSRWDDELYGNYEFFALDEWKALQVPGSGK